MSLGVLQSGYGRPYRSGVLGADLETGPGRPHRAGVLGEYFEGPVAGLGCNCSGVGAEEGISVPTSLILGGMIGAALMYLGGCEMFKK